MAQSDFTTSNYRVNGSQEYFMCDSLLPMYNDIVGSGVTWTYDTIAKIDGETRTITIKDSSDVIFTAMNKFVDNGENTNLFIESGATKDILHGMNISVPDIGFVNAYFDETPKTMEYPFAMNALLKDTIAGYADVVGLGLLDKPLWGNHYVHYDGFGNLQVGNTMIEGVSRLHVYDTLSVDTEDPGIDTIMVLLDVYEYYRFDVSTLPIFQITSLQIGLGGVFMPINRVLSYYDPSVTQTITNDVATNNITNLDFMILPNPAKDQIQLIGDYDNAVVQIINSLGQVVFNDEVQNGMVISTNDLNTGLYLVSVTTNGQTTTKKLIKQ